MNGVIRQFFPKNMRFHIPTAKDIKFVIRRLNHRPRLMARLQNAS
jgi:IS30 family transposase